MGKERVVTILGEQIKVRFNIAVTMLFYDITGELLTMDALNSTKNTLALYGAFIFANNPDTGIDFKRMVTEAPLHEIKTFRAAVIDAIMESCLTEEEMKKYDAAKNELESGMEPRQDQRPS